MVGRRVIVGATGDDDVARDTARRLRDEGREVVFGGRWTEPEQLLQAAVAEDANEIIVSAYADELLRIEAVRADLDVAHVEITPLVPPRQG